mgnify:CR=1 FL=1
MNKPTSIFLSTVRTLEGGSGMYGACEICKGDCSAIYCAQRQQVWQRLNESMYLNPVGAGAYGHTACLISAFGALRRHDDFTPGAGNAPRQVTQEQFEQLKGMT